jgi:hypothetical protein
MELETAGALNSGVTTSPHYLGGQGRQCTGVRPLVGKLV